MYTESNLALPNRHLNLSLVSVSALGVLLVALRTQYPTIEGEKTSAAVRTSNVNQRVIFTHAVGKTFVDRYR